MWFSASAPFSNACEENGLDLGLLFAAESGLGQITPCHT